jgi:uncharacterized protein YcgI (DUF1989 family)
MLQQTITPPRPAYFSASANSPLHPPSALYARIASGPRTPVQTLTIPPRSGLAFRVPATCIFRLSTPLGPQVGDLNIWNAQDPRERFWAARTRQLQGSHLREGDRLWSCLPFMRPLCGVIRDGCGLGERVVRDDGLRRGERTRWGGRCHDLLGTRSILTVCLTATFALSHIILVFGFCFCLALRGARGEEAREQRGKG